MAKAVPPIKALESWVALNDAVRDCSEAVALELLKAEQDGKKRKQFMLRIHSRLNKLRADREREEMLKGTSPPWK